MSRSRPNASQEVTSRATAGIAPRPDALPLPRPRRASAGRRPPLGRPARSLGAALPRPTAILVVSAHWESAPLTIGATADAAPLVYDFYGFPASAITTRPTRPGRRSTGGQGPRPAGRHRASRRRAGSRPGPRRLRAAHGHVPAGGPPGAADLDARPGPDPAAADRRPPWARCAMRAC